MSDFGADSTYSHVIHFLYINSLAIEKNGKFDIGIAETDDEGFDEGMETATKCIHPGKLTELIKLSGFTKRC